MHVTLMFNVLIFRIFWIACNNNMSMLHSSPYFSIVIIVAALFISLAAAGVYNTEIWECSYLFL